MANDPDAYDGAWEEFLLGAIMMGAFHMTGKSLRKQISRQGDGYQKTRNESRWQKSRHHNKRWKEIYY